MTYIGFKQFNILYSLFISHLNGLQEEFNMQNSNPDIFPDY